MPRLTQAFYFQSLEVSIIVDIVCLVLENTVLIEQAFYKDMIKRRFRIILRHVESKIRGRCDWKRSQKPIILR